MRRQILLTNDDGIKSPGLWAAAEALAALGYVTVAAPRLQSSGMGRSLPNTSDGIIQPETMRVHDKEWTVYAVGGSPAQAVLHGVLEIMSQPPDLIVSGINYGENVGTGITISGTVGAALEGASLGTPALAVSLETDHAKHLSYDTDVNFSAAAHFATYFAHALLEKKFPADVMLLKVDVPAEATVRTPWEISRLSLQRYYSPTRPERLAWDVPGKVGYRNNAALEKEPAGTDVHTLRVKKHVAVVPISLDLTARVDFAELDKLLRNNKGG